MSKNLIQLGVCHKPHGIKGGFTFILENTIDSVLKKGVKIMLFPKDTRSSISEEGEEFVVETISFGNKVIAYLKGHDKAQIDRNLVEQMIPFIIKIDRSALPETDEGEYYLSDLVGLEVRNASTNEVIGMIKRTFDNGAQTVLGIKLSSGKMIDVPFVENFVLEVDIESGYISINPPRLV